MSHWEYLESLMLCCNFIGLDFARPVPDFALGFAFGKYGSILRHLLLFDRG